MPPPLQEFQPMLAADEGAPRLQFPFLRTPATPPANLETDAPVKIAARGVSAFYRDKQALFDVNLDIRDRNVTALIGASGCGKTTFLRCVNRMNDSIPGARVEGQIEIGGIDVNQRGIDAVALRSRVGMVFQRPNPFPMSIFDNVAYGPRTLRLAKSDKEFGERVHRSLSRAHLWQEVKDHLDEPALSLSGGQQQRLVIARALAIEPEVILMDEPCSALDPIATAKIEELIDELRQHICIVIVTHSMAQAARVSQFTAFFHMGKLIESGPTAQLFTAPRNEQTQDYITGRFG